MGLNHRVRKAAPVLIGVGIVIRLAALVVVPRNRKPASALAWIFAIFSFPAPAAFLFSLFGTIKLPRARRRKQQEINEFIVETTEGMDRVSEEHTWPLWFRSTVDLNRKLGSMPLVGGNDVTLFPDYHASIGAMAAAIRLATRYVHVEFYLITRDETTKDFFAALAEVKARGVIVKVLYDHLANFQYPFYRETKQWFEQHDIPYREMLPLYPLRRSWRRPDLRNHRKVVVVDGTVGFMGSQNMIDPSYNKPGNKKRGLQWKDLIVRLEGPVVAGVNAIFLTDWYSETNDLLEREADPVYEASTEKSLDCQVVPSGPGFEGENNLRLFNTLVYSAQKRLVIVSPYFVPDDSMAYAITTAAQRGVEVQLFACEVADQKLVYHAQRSYYEDLLRAGVRIFLYKSPIVLHAKHFTVDDDVAVVGSSNMDMRSFSLDLEVSLMIRGRSFVDALREVEDDYRHDSRELMLDEWLARPARSKALDNLARLTAAIQ